MTEKTPGEKLEAFGTDALCDAIINRKHLSEIAADVGVAESTLLKWIAADSERSARARDARRESARGWEELAEKDIKEAKDPFELAKAKELAHHRRWRASKINPDFADKVAHTHGGEDGGPIPIKATIAVSEQTAEQIYAEMTGAAGASS